MPLNRLLVHSFQCAVLIDSNTDIFTAADGGCLPVPPGAVILTIENKRVKFPNSRRHKNKTQKTIRRLLHHLVELTLSLSLSFVHYSKLNLTKVKARSNGAMR